MNGFNNLALSCLFFSALDLSGLAQSSIITTYAGRGRTLPVSGAQAITQAIDDPVSVVADAAGGFYIASSQQHRIYRVGADGTLTAVAGTGIRGLFRRRRSRHCPPSSMACATWRWMGAATYSSPTATMVAFARLPQTVSSARLPASERWASAATAAPLPPPSSTGRGWCGCGWRRQSVHRRLRQQPHPQGDSSGIITTVAGNGESGFSGDGGPATAARSSHLASGVAVDGAGNLFIADSQNNRIRKVTPAGIISTVAGMR